MGYDKGASSALTGSSGAVPIWVNIMKKTNRIWPESDFAFPDTVVRRMIDLFGTEIETEMIFKK